MHKKMIERIKEMIRKLKEIVSKLILKIAYNKTVGIACDTHVFRISHRLGLADAKTPDGVSK